MAGHRNLVVGIYFHPEAYPPTLNAIGELSDCFKHITLIHRPHLRGSWKYPANVSVVPAGPFMSSQDQQLAPLHKKVAIFLRFLFVFYKQCMKEKPTWILVYDNMSLFAYYLTKRLFYFKHQVWYHNHDVIEAQKLRKYSIGWFAAKAEKTIFSHLNVFSLPSNDRLKYFPMQQCSGQYFFIPNYPAKRFYLEYYHRRSIEKTIKLIFQGQVGPWHGIEEILPLLKNSMLHYRLELVLKGPCMAAYKNHILKMAGELNVTDKVHFIGVTPYNEVPEASSRCHIGIAILARNDLMNTTLGTASNKIYEYAAVGLPVIYYNSANFTKYLHDYSWAVPADLTSQSIEQAIETIARSYNNMSNAAHGDFVNFLNFENGFKQVKTYIKNSV